MPFSGLGMTINELLDIIQASEEELKKGLHQYECVQVDKMWFILDQDYQMMVLSRILKYILLLQLFLFTLL